LHGQTTEKGATFQYFVNGDPAATKIRTLQFEVSGKTVTGKPFSAAEERQTVQVLGDGTRIDKKETDKYFRDSQGRTRTERDNGSTIIIFDPVEGFNAELNTSTKSAHKMVFRMNGPNGPQTQGAMIMMDKMKSEMIARPMQITSAAGPVAGNIAFTRAEPAMALKEDQNAAAEDLGTQMINGVPAQGTRSTITIPVGQIGNDREIKVVSERWFSNELQMLIRSSNKDPRFGETTYELTNILQGAQDPTLFQIPADFNLNGPPAPPR
jgi:hypothetical protein